MRLFHAMYITYAMLFFFFLNQSAREWTESFWELCFYDSLTNIISDAFEEMYRGLEMKSQNTAETLS